MQIGLVIIEKMIQTAALISKQLYVVQDVQCHQVDIATIEEP
jgi:hypothetical protein